MTQNQNGDGNDSNNELNLVESVRQTLHDEMGRDEKMVIYGEDVGVDGGVFRTTKGIIDEYPDRIYDTPLAEAGIVGTAVGMGVYGLRPVVEIQFSGFMPQAFHQIKQHVSRLRSRSRGSYNCPITIRAPYGGGVHALEHHSESFEAAYSHIPGLKVVIPSNPSDAKGLLTSAIRDPDPVVFLEPKKLYRAFREDVPEGEHTVPLEEARVVSEGDDVSLVSWGAMVRESLKAVDEVEESVEVIDLRTVSPLDAETVVESVKKTGRCVVVQEAPRTLGVSSEVVSRINDEALLYLEAPVERVTAPDVPYPFPEREGAYMPDKEQIAEAVRQTAEF